ncbi:hypothetical protein [Streptomyces sp. NPDC056883]|uniref:phage terminase small subunit n=1 Tax=Streptomyces sp. NPDC056883 TaxID=3345959 RepID=UPI0036CC0543
MARNGFSGPAPKRPEERRRVNKDVIDLKIAPKHYANVAKGRDGFDDSWHPIAQRIYLSFVESPQSFFFEPSDWAQLRLVVESAHISLTRYYDRVSIDMVTAVIDALQDFLTTEATRRRVRVAVEPTPVEWPASEEHWHEIAKAWFESLAKSGQAAFYQQSDIAFATYVAEVMDRYLSAGIKMSGRLLALITKACGLLLTTEASRRIAQMELTKVETRDIDAEVTKLMEQYANAL